MKKPTKKQKITISDWLCLVAVCGVIGGIASKDIGLSIVSGVLLVLCGYFANRTHTKRYKFIENMDGLAFENYCAQQLAKSKQFKSVKTTPPSGDFGADIVATAKDGQRWVFQCKRYSGKLDNTPIQEVVGAMAHYNAQRAGVITNSEFTAPARLLAKENNVELWEGAKFRSLVNL